MNDQNANFPRSHPWFVNEHLFSHPLILYVFSLSIVSNDSFTFMFDVLKIGLLSRLFHKSLFED